MHLENWTSEEPGEIDLSDIIHKIGSALVEEVRHLPPDLRWILFEDLATAFVNRKRVFEAASTQRLPVPKQP